MNLEERIQSFVKLGEFLSGLFEEKPTYLLDDLEILKEKIEKRKFE